VLEPITGNFKASYFSRILDKFSRTAKPIRIIGGPDNQRPDKLSSTVLMQSSSVPTKHRYFVLCVSCHAHQRWTRGVCDVFMTKYRCVVVCGVGYPDDGGDRQRNMSQYNLDCV